MDSIIKSQILLILKAVISKGIFIKILTSRYCLHIEKNNNSEYPVSTIKNMGHKEHMEVSFNNFWSTRKKNKNHPTWCNKKICCVHYGYMEPKVHICSLFIQVHMKEAKYHTNGYRKKRNECCYWDHSH